MQSGFHLGPGLRRGRFSDMTAFFVSHGMSYGWAWFVATIVGILVIALPLMLAGHHTGHPLSFTHAYFEAVSGLTTTGSTVLAGLDAMPVSVNVW
eukprot:gene12153-14856_t